MLDAPIDCLIDVCLQNLKVLLSMPSQAEAKTQDIVFADNSSIGFELLSYEIKVIKEYEKYVITSASSCGSASQ